MVIVADHWALSTPSRVTPIPTAPSENSRRDRPARTDGPSPTMAPRDGPVARGSTTPADYARASLDRPDRPCGLPLSGARARCGVWESSTNLKAALRVRFLAWLRRPLDRSPRGGHDDEHQRHRLARCAAG